MIYIQSVRIPDTKLLFQIQNNESIFFLLCTDYTRYTPINISHNVITVLLKENHFLRASRMPSSEINTPPQKSRIIQPALQHVSEKDNDQCVNRRRGLCAECFNNNLTCCSSLSLIIKYSLFSLLSLASTVSVCQCFW